MSTELKVVMFTDQVKSTTKTEQRTHAEVEQTHRAQNDLTAEALRRTRGVELKNTGDGCLAQFASVLEAVQAGMLLQQGVAERNAALTADTMRFELHVGIDVGDLVVLENGDVRGEAANRAARICDECPPGEVYLSDAAANVLKRNEVELKPVGPLPLKGVERETTVYRVAALRVWPEGAANPFIWRGGLRRPEDFFNRSKEMNTLRAYVRGGQNCQIIDARRYGKTSLLRQVERSAAKWKASAIAAYLDLQDPRCYSLSGWLSHVSRQFGWPAPAADLIELPEMIESMIGEGKHPILCLDDFEEIAARHDEFDGEFFSTLRSCSMIGLSIITASQKPLSTLVLEDGLSSPLHNIFPLLRLEPFSDEEANSYVTLPRFGVRPFSAIERRAILTFAKGHPLALQVACFHVLQAKESGETLSSAIEKAEDNMKSHLPSGW